MTAGDAETIRRTLPDVGEGLAAQLAELSRAPTPERCERVAIDLQGAFAAVLRFRERLLAGEVGDAE